MILVDPLQLKLFYSIVMDSHDTDQTLSPNKKVLRKESFIILPLHIQQRNKQSFSGRNTELSIKGSRCADENEWPAKLG